MVNLHATNVRSVGVGSPFLVSGVLLNLLQSYLLLLDGVMDISEPSRGYEGDLPEGLGLAPELSFHLGDASVGAPTGRLG